MENMKEYAVRHERLVWFEKPPSATRKRTFNAQAAAEHYTEDDRAVALAKGKGRVTNEALDRGRPPRTFIDERALSRLRASLSRRLALKRARTCLRARDAHRGRSRSAAPPLEVFYIMR